MRWNQHGEFSLRCHGDVLVIEAAGDWNHIAVRNLRLAAEPYWQGLAQTRWALLIDSRSWGAVTPEGFELWQSLIEDGALAAGVHAFAFVLPSAFHEQMVREGSKRLSQLARFHLGTVLEDAQRWLELEGFCIDRSSPSASLAGRG